jgi:hypothetical protein
VNPENLNEVIQAIMNSLDQVEPSKQPLQISPLGDGNAGKRIARLLQLFVEKDIRREFEAKIMDHAYPVPYITDITDLDKVCDVALCFEDHLPLAHQVYEEQKNSDMKKKETLCIVRGALTKNELVKIIEVNWDIIDKYLNEMSI